jgi:hypothetical protein
MAFPHPLSLPSQGPAMNPIPTNHYTSYDDPDLSLIPSTTHQREPKGKETFHRADLFFDDSLSLGDFGDDNHVVPVPQVPRGTLPRNMKPVFRPVNDSPRCHVWPGAIPQIIPQPPNLNAHPPFGVHPTIAAPRPPTFGAFESAHEVFPQSSTSHLGVSSSATFDGGTPPVHVWQGATPQMRHEADASGFSSHPQPNVHPAIAHQLTFNTSNGVFDRSPQPLPLYPATSSPAVERGGAEQVASLSSIQNIPFPMTSGPAPAWPSSTPVVPISGPPISASVHLRRPSDARAVAMSSAAAVAPATITTNFTHSEPRQVPAPRGWCPECVRPLVRVDNTEWVRPDVMKVVLYFNFSSNVGAGAQSSWESRDA